jgi:hypothetical protein
MHPQAEVLDRILWRCRDLFNAALYQRREAYRDRGVSVGYDAQHRDLLWFQQVDRQE